MIATITSILKPTRSSLPSSLERSDSQDEERLIPHTSNRTSPERTYGTLPYYGSSITPSQHTPHVGHTAEDEALDGNDQAVWGDVQTQGLDGRGSIAATDESVDEEHPLDKYEEEQAQLKDVTYRQLVARYASVPVVIALVFYSLVLLIQYAWPPTSSQRENGSPYPHPFLYKPFLLGLFTSTSVQAMRLPLLDAMNGLVLTLFGVEVLGRKGGLALLVLSVTLHTILHELIRLLSLLLLLPIPSTTLSPLPSSNDLFQHVYHLALGWGIAEASWGIASAWGQGMRLYWDVMRQPTPKVVIENMRSEDLPRRRGWWARLTGSSNPKEKKTDVENHTTPPRQVDIPVGHHAVISTDFVDQANVSETSSESEREEEEEEEDLERKIGILERMKGRRDLEEVLGQPFPNIPLVLHYLWRIDTLLLNLGLTLFVSAYYFNPEPIYPPSHAHPPFPPMEEDTPADRHPHRLLPLVVIGVTLVHAIITLLWNLSTRKLGVGAISWGSLIISLGSLFAGIGAWGGLV